MIVRTYGNIIIFLIFFIYYMFLHAFAEYSNQINYKEENQRKLFWDIFIEGFGLSFGSWEFNEENPF